MLRVSVFSEDSEIQRLCRETLGQLADLEWAFTIPEHLVIASRGEIGDVAADLPAAAADILLKPITHTALRTFIEMVVRREQTGPDGTRASHDLRTPLTAASGYCGLMLNELLGPLSEEQKQALLLDNACRFTPRGGSIELSGYAYFWDRRLSSISGCAFSDRRHEDSRTPNCYRIDIRDSGPGILPDHLHGIFEEYTPYANSSDRSGGGLALAVCKSIMEAHHGRVWAEDGALFCLVIPFRHSEPAPGAFPAGLPTASGIYAGIEKQ